MMSANIRFLQVLISMLIYWYNMNALRQLGFIEHTIGDHPQSTIT